MFEVVGYDDSIIRRTSFPAQESQELKQGVVSGIGALGVQG